MNPETRRIVVEEKDRKKSTFNQTNVFLRCSFPNEEKQLPSWNILYLSKTMKLTVLASILASAAAFAPASTGRVSTQVAESKVRTILLRSSCDSFFKTYNITLYPALTHSNRLILRHLLPSLTLLSDILTLLVSLKLDFGDNRMNLPSDGFVKPRLSTDVLPWPPSLDTAFSRTSSSHGPNTWMEQPVPPRISLHLNNGMLFLLELRSRLFFSLDSLNFTASFPLSRELNLDSFITQRVANLENSQASMLSHTQFHSTFTIPLSSTQT